MRLMTDREAIHVKRQAGGDQLSKTWCGRTVKMVNTITGIMGFYGPGGAGYPDLCRVCVKNEAQVKASRRSRR